MDAVQQQISDYVSDVRAQARAGTKQVGTLKELASRAAGQKIDEGTLDAHLQSEYAGSNAGLTGAQIIAAQATIDTIHAALDAKGAQDSLYAVI